MISQLRGKISYTTDKFVILDVAGVGYRINLTATDLAHLPAPDAAGNGGQAELKFWTHLAVREDSMELYGFLNKKEHDFFELLISISGIGPKKALGILSVAPVETLKKALRTKDISYLTQVSGIGRKNAEKIVLELKDKFAVLDGEEGGANLREESDAISAIKSLGYSTSEARDALQKVPTSVTKINDRIREALKHLGK
jgi:Holliday junction DNA helicase RuvA